MLPDTLNDFVINQFNLIIDNPMRLGILKNCNICSFSLNTRRIQGMKSDQFILNFVGTEFRRRGLTRLFWRYPSKSLLEISAWRVRKKVSKYSNVSSRKCSLVWILSQSMFFCLRTLYLLGVHSVTDMI